MHFKLGQKIIDKLRDKIKNETVLKNSISTNIYTNLINSLSNNGCYPQFCLLASINDKIFNKFKQSDTYKQILEHTSKEQGMSYINRINELDKNLLKEGNIENFKKNDLYGGASLENYTEIKQISPSTLRYISVLAEVKNIFNTLDDKKVCEIGIGYGGQCRIFTEYFKIEKYTLIDLYPVLRLGQKFLDNFPLTTELEFKTMNELSYNTKYDFVLSNYAFSELSRELQTIYLDKVIKNSKSGYMIMNCISDVVDGFNSLTKDELLKIIPNNPIILPEVPNTFKGNYVIAWGC